MPKTINKDDKNVKENITEWDIIIKDAKKHIDRLKAAIRHAEQMKAAGESLTATRD
jgi:hypothetical protein